MKEFGCRIPCKYFVTSGKGQTSEGSSSDHWETGAYDLALLDAQIGNWNIMQYTSVIPPQAKQIAIEDALDNYYTHGAVLESIMAQANGDRGEFICAGVGTIEVHHLVDGEIWVKIGGFAAEFEGNCSEDMAKKHLKEALEGIFQRRYSGKDDYKMGDMTFETTSLMIDEAWGTCLSAICFVTHEIPFCE